MTAAISILTLTLPLPPKLTNSGSGRSRHWRALEREKKAYWSSLDMLQLIGRIPRPPKYPIGAAQLAVRMTLGNRMDTDNAVARCKWPLDWLERRGYIENDRLLEWIGMPTQTIKRGDRYLIELTITPRDCLM